jgi:polysaccharide pyruvyl transferase WcaK-like protein
MDAEGEAPAPRILIENSEYWLSNVGDLAMMDVTIRRLRERWPQASIGVLTNAPHLLRAYFPDALPIQPRGRDTWSGAGAVAEFLAGTGPRRVGPVEIGWVTTKAWLPQKAVGLRRKLRKLVALARSNVQPEHTAPAATVRRPAAGEAMSHRPNTVAAARTSSLVLALGGGYLTDADPAQSHRVLDLLELAQNLGTRTALVGQGLGPVEDPELVSRLAEVLPRVDFIGLRERRRGPLLLARAGVPTSHFEVTGDDAVEMSFAQRREVLGSDIGVCLRVAGYSPVSTDVRRSLPFLLQDAARDCDAGLVPVFIAEYRSQDRRSTLPLIRGYEAARRPLHRFAYPREVAEQISGCRVLVTGAYHAAVFALAQGIPVVALSTSQYYDDKFLGLADMFPGGLQLLRLDDAVLAVRLPQAIFSAWDGAPDVRSTLRERAQEQIAASRDGLDRVLDLVDTQPPVRS